FERIDEEETARRRRDVEAQQPFVFEHDPSALERLAHDPSALEGLAAILRNHLSEVAQAATIADLPVETRNAFGLVSESAPFSMLDDPEQDDMGRGFASLKKAVSGEMGTAGNRITEIIAEFTEFIGPLRRNGLLIDPEELDREGIR